LVSRRPTLLVDRYDPLNLFERIPSLGMQMDPVLAQLDRLLDHDGIVQSVKADLVQRYPQTLRVGRPSTLVAVILRMLVIKHLYGWSFEQTEHFVADSLRLRQSGRVYAEHVPDAPTLIRRAGLIQPATLQPLLDHVTDLARELKVTGGRKLRIDGTVVERHIPHPSDSTLLNDGVRVLARVMRKARAPGCCGRGGLASGPAGGCRQAARAGMKRMMDVARKKGETAADALKTAYQELLVVSQSVVAQAQQTAQALTSAANATAQRCGDQLATMVPRVAQVIEQRVLS
jgi:IS5 family transposase